MKGIFRRPFLEFYAYYESVFTFKLEMLGF